MKKIVFTGGGSAGHIMPNIAIMQDLQNYEIYYMGTNGMEKDIVSKMKNVKYIEIPSVKFIRSFTLKNLAIPFKLFKSIKVCKQKLRRINPDIIFSKGGYVSIPVCLAGAKLNIPTLTHESDLTVGLANKIIARHSKYLCCSFQETALKYGRNSIYTGSPIRHNILHGDKNIVLNKHNIKTNKPIVLIVGGSLGAKAINTVIWNNIKPLTQKYTIIHLVGKNNINKSLTNLKDYIQLEFVHDIQNYFSASDIVISRAGSNTIFELLTLSKPMILIPLPLDSSRGDQILNAENFEKNGFASTIKQEDLTPELLLKMLSDTLKKSSNYISKMRKCNKDIGNKKIIDLINKVSSTA